MVEFKKITDYPKGTLYHQLCDAYSFDSGFKNAFDNLWKEYDNFFYSNPILADKYGFITVVNKIPIGHITWDPRKKPEYVQIGHNCIISEYKNKGYGKLQLEEAIRRIKEYKVKKIVVTTNELLFPAQKNYESIGFKIVRTRKNKETPFTGNYIDYELAI